MTTSDPGPAVPVGVQPEALDGGRWMTVADDDTEPYEDVAARIIAEADATAGVGVQPAERAEPQYGIENGWLFEYVNEHTCGTGRDGYYGAHEPGCGTVPIARIEDLLRDSAAVVAALREDLATRIVASPSVVAVREDTGMSVPAIKAVLQSVATLIRGERS